MIAKTFTIQKCTWLFVAMLCMYFLSCKESKTQPDKNNIPKEAMEFSMEEMKKDIYSNNHMVAYRHRDPEEKWRDKEKEAIVQVLAKFDNWVASSWGSVGFNIERESWMLFKYSSSERKQNETGFNFHFMKNDQYYSLLNDSIIPSLKKENYFKEDLMNKLNTFHMMYGDSASIFTFLSGNSDFLKLHYITLLGNKYIRGSLYDQYYLNDPNYYGENGEPYPTMDMKHAIFYHKQMIKLYTPNKALYKVKSQLLGSDYNSFVCIILEKDTDGNWKISDFIVPKPEELVEPKYKIDIEEYTTKPYIKG